MPYISHTIKNIITVSKIINCYKKTLSPDFTDVPESHGFREAVYVEDGKISALAEGVKVPLKKGDIFIHKPFEEHSVIIEGEEPATVYFISFYSKSSALSLLDDTLLTLTPYLKTLVHLIYDEAKLSFVPAKKGDRHGLAPSPDAPLGSDQLYRNYLESFLINLLRLKLDKDKSTIYSEKKEFHSSVARKIMKELSASVYSTLSIDDLSKKLNYGRTFICTVFKEETGLSINSFYTDLKIKEAKRLIDEGKLNFTEISEKLNFSSPYYFTKVFKKSVGLSPSEYKKKDISL